MTTLMLSNDIDRCTGVDEKKLLKGCIYILLGEDSPDFFRKFPESYLLFSISKEYEKRKYERTLYQLPKNQILKAEKLSEILVDAKKIAGIL